MRTYGSIEEVQSATAKTRRTYVVALATTLRDGGNVEKFGEFVADPTVRTILFRENAALDPSGQGFGDLLHFDSLADFRSCSGEQRTAHVQAIATAKRNRASGNEMRERFGAYLRGPVRCSLLREYGEADATTIAPSYVEYGDGDPRRGSAHARQHGAAAQAEREAERESERQAEQAERGARKAKRAAKRAEREAAKVVEPEPEPNDDPVYVGPIGNGGE